MLFHYRLPQGGQGSLLGPCRGSNQDFRACFSLGFAVSLQAPGCNVTHNLPTSVLVSGDLPLLDAKDYIGEWEWPQQIVWVFCFDKISEIILVVAL